MRTIAALLLTVLLGAGLTACSEDEADQALQDARERASEAVEQAQDVDWEAYSAEVREDIENAIAEADCENLDEELGKLDEGQDSELIAFLQEQIERVGCG